MQKATKLEIVNEPDIVAARAAGRDLAKALKKEELYESSSSVVVIQRGGSILPLFMVPQQIVTQVALPRSANGKIDRQRIRDELTGAVEKSVA